MFRGAASECRIKTAISSHHYTGCTSQKQIGIKSDPFICHLHMPTGTPDCQVLCMLDTEYWQDCIPVTVPTEKDTGPGFLYLHLFGMLDIYLLKTREIISNTNGK